MFSLYQLKCAQTWSVRGRHVARCSSMAAEQHPKVGGPRQDVWLVGRHKTEVLHLQAIAEPTLQVVVFPGNPGQAHFYQSFMQSVHTLLSGRASVTTVSQLGVDGKGLSPPGKVFSLEEQIEHKVLFLREYMLGEGRPPVVILAHSIGTYMSIHAVHRLEQRATPAPTSIASSVADAAAFSTPAALSSLLSNVEQGTGQEGLGSGGGTQHCGVVKVIGLFPFLTISPDCPKQARLSRLTHLHGPLAHLAAALRLLPMPACRWLVARCAPELEDHAVETALQLLHPTSVRNSLYLGRCEFQTLTAPADWWLLRRLGRRFAVFCCPNDQWMPEWKWRQMLQEVPGVEAYWEEAQCHAFCVSRAKSHDLALKIATLLGYSAEHRTPLTAMGPLPGHMPSKL